MLRMDDRASDVVHLCLRGREGGPGGRSGARPDAARLVVRLLPGNQPRTHGGQVGVVRRSRNGDRLRASALHVAHPVAHDLDGVRPESVLVHQHVVVRRAHGPLDPRLGAEKEVVAVGTGDVRVHHRSRLHVPTSVRDVVSLREQARVVPLLDDDVGDGRRVVRVRVAHLAARLSDGLVLVRQHPAEEALRHAVPEHDDGLGPLLVVVLVEVAQESLDGLLHVDDDLLARRLRRDAAGVAGRHGIDASHDGGDRREVGAGRGVRHVRSHDDVGSALVHHGQSAVGRSQQNRVGAAHLQSTDRCVLGGDGRGGGGRPTFTLILSARLAQYWGRPLGGRLSPTPDLSPAKHCVGMPTWTSDVRLTILYRRVSAEAGQIPMRRRGGSAHFFWG